jgi:hypothetical protein
MTTSLQDRFRRVDAIPTPWDERARALPQPVPVGTKPHRGFALTAAAAAVAIVAVIGAVVVSGDNSDTEAPRADASWLVAQGSGSCVERYSVETLADRGYAFEGVITDVAGPSDPTSPDPGGQTTTVSFDVVRWFWGGSGPSATRRTYSVASSAGELDASIGARLLVAGDEDFIWACGFSQQATETARSDYEAAAGRRSA